MEVDNDLLMEAIEQALASVMLEDDYDVTKTVEINEIKKKILMLGCVHNG